MMMVFRRALIAVAILPLAGCFQASTIVRVKPDGSGTIEQRILLTDAAMDQLRAFAILGGNSADSVDPTSEAQARSMAAAIGPGVTYVSSMPARANKAQGRDTIYAFTDITQLRISEQPKVPGGVSLRSAGVSTDGEPITFALARQPDGNVQLRILVPRPGMLPLATPNANGDVTPPSVEQIEMVRGILAGARLSVAIEPEGQLVSTTSPFVEGNRVTLIDLDIDKAGSDPDLVKKLQSPKTLEDAKAAINSVPGLKITLDPEISITFTPK
jgi:hypothetical protein